LPLVSACVQSPPPEEQEFQQRWGTPEASVLTSWHRGLQLRKDPEWSEVVERASSGELPVLSWHGGIDPESKKKPRKRLGSLNYLAMWQGLCGEDLHVDTDAEVALVCRRTGVRVIFRATALTADAESPAARAPAEARAVANRGGRGRDHSGPFWQQAVGRR